ncbi:hypothetical protein H5410_052667 [Solanum commersonii]|uniref:Uncharacterized protein n=1 Tax=Solanum commersonii TaxID=4109 RepID=A0A9J5X4S4_SOLCO|nr:hypothetical protein H5410_052667 [Solanum commersonii]
MHGEMNVFPNSRNTETTQVTPPTENLIELLVNETFGGLRREGVDVGPSSVVEEEEKLHDTPDLNKKNLFELLKDGSQELYDSKYLKLKFLLKLYHIKCLSGLSAKGMTMILDLLRDAFKFAKIPDSFYEAKKTINKLSLDYIKINGCPNDCMLYWEDYVNAETCKLNRPKRVNDEPSHNEASGKSSMFPQQGKPVGDSTTEPFATLEKTQAHRYVLLNCASVKPFIKSKI